ncbi:AAA family ATPase [Flavobacterium sp. DSP2-3-1]|uniref:AAA family ATPase n=1 Tax=Flavobacterium sp. DSP2-3-1 TaxID=2804620 RepID=UPI003CE7F836
MQNIIENKMTPVQIRLHTEDFRSINSADIIINGITVVAGENGCGKSTLSKLLYYLYKTISNYDVLVSGKLSSDLSNVARFLEIAQMELFNKSYDRPQRLEFQKDFNNLRREIIRVTPDEKQLQDWLKFVDKIAFAISLKNPLMTEGRHRLRYIAKDIIKNIKIDDVGADDNPFELVKLHVDSLFKETFGLITSRSTNLFKNELQNVFHDSNIPGIFDVFEFGQQIVGLNKNNLSIPYTIQNVIYIDTPMMIGVETDENEYWKDLNKILTKKSLNSFSQFSELISKEIIDGDVSFDDSILALNDFSYKRSDGSVFNLLDCATGIKSFSILQLLLKNGSLSDKTLLIIDEPESHLHPQWIIEYARLIVLLNKNIGIKFFIASHNPDMVSAIRIISEKEDTLSDLNFYLAEKINKYSYDYRHLGIEIDPIFESFNIALDRMNLYGGE